MKRIIWSLAFGAIGLMPAIAFAEVSDKMPSIPVVLILGLVIGGALFLAARFRWWLGILLLPIPVLFVSESISLWNEVGMREALLTEQGWVYFGALGVQGALLLIGIAIGIIVGYKRKPGRAVS